MTVKELIERLSKMPEDALIVLSKDSEGNDFSPLAEDIYGPPVEEVDGEQSVVQGWYTAESTWSGTFEWGEGHKTNAVCLWPVN